MMVTKPKNRYLHLKTEIEDIRTTSANIHVVVKRLQDMWKSVGLNVKFHDYPASYHDKVSNTHNAPTGYPQNWHRHGDKPQGYPGWRGNWSGVVEVLDNTLWDHAPYFSDLRSGIHKKGIPAVPWIKTGTGGGGDSFRFDGMMYMYDFPVMEEEFIASGGNFNTLKQEYADALTAYHERYLMEKSKYVNRFHNTYVFRDLIKDAEKLKASISDAERRSIEYYTSEFNEKYGIELPKAPSIFIDDKIAQKVHLGSTTISTAPLPELESTVEHLKVLADRLTAHLNNNPELFV